MSDFCSFLFIFSFLFAILAFSLSKAEQEHQAVLQDLERVRKRPSSRSAMLREGSLEQWSRTTRSFPFPKNAHAVKVYILNNKRICRNIYVYIYVYNILQIMQYHIVHTIPQCHALRCGKNQAVILNRNRGDACCSSN